MIWQNWDLFKKNKREALIKKMYSNVWAMKSDQFRAESSFLGWAGPGQASRSTEKALKNQPLGPCPCEREPHFELDSLNETKWHPSYVHFTSSPFWT